ncbi:MAG: type II toxin-antitoxin system prevent-host-death family antitoxin [Anderseniella sp.]|jgi:prevent-host-death family protein|nr:type II toxin-antitoxin system prevent-host-death family antitoxin [Anderseniella sp.]
MKEVGAFEAKTHLSELLELASRGEEILITRRGKPVARLVPASRTRTDAARAAFDKLKTLRAQSRLDGLDWKSLRDEGRR